jgi:PIN domain nuclease of toxin-antitoxin system
VAEVGDRLSRIGQSVDIERALRELDIEIVPADFPLALDAAALFMPTRRAGLSLGDRFCMALAKRLKTPAITSDRRWTDIADAVGVQVELIR